MPSWLPISESTLLWAFGAGLVMFFGTLAVVPLIVLRIPADYFAGSHRPQSKLASLHPVLRIVLLILKNLLGLGVFLMGVAMLVLPGQGLLTMLIGLMLIDFPGKFALEKWLVSRRVVFRSINWLRTHYGRPLLLAP
jgi:hypothetical protein